MSYFETFEKLKKVLEKALECEIPEQVYTLMLKEANERKNR